jgi:glyoxylase-like metal-dependent hydrolase (beta-lactamase superfamily II)/ferredoxin
MASPGKRYPDNAPGEFYVDRSCIDCAVCRWVAPEVFAEAGDHSRVARQPADDAGRLRAGMALVACPTASIGTVSRLDVGAAVSAYPESIHEEVYFCGYTSEDSFGAASYLIRRPAGNLLIDSPRAAGPLLARIEKLGGVETMFLTHRDDVADHEAFHRRFGCARVMHEDDVTRATRRIERRIAGGDPVALADDLLVIPTPGHTRGHAVLLYREKYLFTGDHLAWSPTSQRLYAFRDACWYSWDQQIQSMERLLDYRFEWVLPGHGWRHQSLSAEEMRREIERCISWMKERAAG